MASYTYSVVERGKCHLDNDPTKPHTAPVLRCSVKGMPDTCAPCAVGKIDVPMDWKLSRTAVQILVHRAASERIHEEQEAMESLLPEELRSKPRR